MDKFETMSKMELRAACKEAGIKNYGKMNNAQMRIELQAKEEIKVSFKIEKNREERNGIKRPSAGGKCRAIWDAIDALQNELETGEKVTVAMVKDLAKDENWNLNNAVIEFYQWRKFNSRGE